VPTYLSVPYFINSAKFDIANFPRAKVVCAGMLPVVLVASRTRISRICIRHHWNGISSGIGNFNWEWKGVGKTVQVGENENDRYFLWEKFPTDCNVIVGVPWLVPEVKLPS